MRLSLHQLCAYNSEITTLQEASAFLRLVCTGVATLNRLMRTAALLQSSASRPHRPSYLDLILAERAALLEDDPPLDPIADPEFFPDPLHSLSRNTPLDWPTNRLRSPNPPSCSAPDPDPDDDIPPAIGPDGPIDFEANFYDPALSPFWMEPPEMIATMPGREKKSATPPKPATPERSARWYSPALKTHRKELFLIDFPRKRLHSGRGRPHRRKGREAPSAF